MSERAERMCRTCGDPIEPDIEGSDCRTCLIAILSGQGSDEDEDDEPRCPDCGGPCEDGDPARCLSCDGDGGGDGEPEEGDYTTEDHGRFYQYGKLVVEVDAGEPWAHAVKARMDAEQFWPNVWFVSDHGNSHLIDMFDALREADEEAGS